MAAIEGISGRLARVHLTREKIDASIRVSPVLNSLRGTRIPPGEKHRLPVGSFFPCVLCLAERAFLFISRRTFFVGRTLSFFRGRLFGPRFGFRARAGRARRAFILHRPEADFRAARGQVARNNTALVRPNLLGRLALFPRVSPAAETRTCQCGKLA